MDEDQLIRKFITCSRWSARILVFGAITSLIWTPFIADPLETPDSFWSYTLKSALLLVYHIWIQTYSSFGEPKDRCLLGYPKFLIFFDLLFLSIMLAISVPVFNALFPPIGAFENMIYVSFLLFTGIKLVGILGLIILRICIILRMLKLKRPFHLRTSHFLSEIPVLGGKLYGLVGEHGLLIFFRISMMITLIYILIAFLVHSVILGPVGDRTSIRTYHRQDEGSADQWLSLPLQIYMVVKPSQPSAEQLAAAVNVTAIGESGQVVLCHLTVRESSSNFVCPPSNVTIHGNPTTIFPAFYNTIMTVDFTTLNASSTVYVYVGLTAIGDDLYSSSVPIPLDVDSHIYRYLNVKSREVLNNPSSALLGFFPTSRELLYLDTYPLLPDTSTLITRNINTATLRLKRPHEGIQRDIIVLADTREKTMLSGLGAIGGLWTLINGFFALLFGGSLLYNLRKASQRLWLFTFFSEEGATPYQLLSPALLPLKYASQPTFHRA